MEATEKVGSEQFLIDDQLDVLQVCNDERLSQSHH
jgi:hypothetical protein